MPSFARRNACEPEVSRANRRLAFTAIWMGQTEVFAISMSSRRILVVPPLERLMFKFAASENVQAGAAWRRGHRYRARSSYRFRIDPAKRLRATDNKSCDKMPARMELLRLWRKVASSTRRAERRYRELICWKLASIRSTTPATIRAHSRDGTSLLIAQHGFTELKQMSRSDSIIVGLLRNCDGVMLLLPNVDPLGWTLVKSR